MTPACCSVHTHSVLCDGKSTLAEMAEAAFAAGVRYFGVSSHSPTPIPYDAGNVLPEDLTAYRQAVLSLRETYACLLYTSPSPRDRCRSRMPSSA